MRSPSPRACRPDFPGATGEAIPLRGLEGVPGLPGAPQDEAGSKCLEALVPSLD